MERSVRAILRADVGQFEAGMQSAARATEQVGQAADRSARTTEQATQRQTSSARSFSQRLTQSARENERAWTTVGGALATVGAATTGLMAVVAHTGISYNSLRQTATAALTSVTGSTEGAVAQMARLDEFGSTSWLMRDSLIRAQQQMTGFGIETSKAVPYMDALSEAVAATGGNNQTFEELALIMAKVAGQGKITAEELNQFGERGIDAATLIGEAMGKTGAEIREEITSGSLDAGTALDALAQGMQVKYAGSSDLVRNTFRGAVDDVKAAFRDLSATAMSLFVNPEGGGLFVGILSSLSDVMFALRDLPGPIVQVGGALTGLGGLAALAGGGFMLLAPRLVETWDALDNLGTIGPRVKDLLRGLPSSVGRAATAFGQFATAAVGAMAAFEGGRLIGSAIGNFNDAAVAVDLLTSRLESLGEQTSGYDAILGDLDLGAAKFSDLQTTVESLSNLSGLDAFLHNMERAADRSHVAAEGLEQAGVVLRQMSEQDFDAAAESFRNLAMEAGATDQAALALLDTMPAFRDHLEAIALDAGLAGEDFEILRIAMGHLPPAVEEATVATQNYAGALAGIAETQAEAKAQLDEWRESMGQAAASFGGVIEGYAAVAEATESGTVSMSAWIEQMEAQAEAVANWQENTLTASAQIREELPADMQVAGRAMVEEMTLAGEEGAQALATFVNASPAERARLIEAWQGTGYDLGIMLADELTSAPDGEVGANTFPAEQALSAYLGAVANSEEHVVVNGNPVPAEAVLSAVRQAIRNTEEPVTINGNDAPADQVLNALQSAIANSEEYVTINGNRTPTDQVVMELMAWVARQQGTVRVFADTGAAMSRLGVLQNTLNSINGRTVTASVAIRQYGQAAVASGGYMGDFARMPGFAGGGSPKRYPNGGEVFGPGTPTSDSIAARLSRTEFVQRGAAVRKYGLRFMHDVNSMRFPVELAQPGALRAALSGVPFREGGSPVGMSGPSITRAPRPSAAQSVTYQVHIHGAPADQHDRFAAAALFEMRRFENDSVHVRMAPHA